MTHPNARATVRTMSLSLALAAGLLLIAAPMNAATAASSNWLGGGERVQGSGKIIKQNREPGRFTALATSVGGGVEIRMGDTESVSVESDDNIVPLIETVVEDGTLRIRPAKPNLNLDTRNMKIVVQVRKLDKISVAGSGAVEVNQLRVESLKINVGGSGSINLRDLRSESLMVALGGSGGLSASGNVERVQVSIGGSGQVRAEHLAARAVTVSIGGSGQATVWASKSLHVSVAGSGDIGYYGDPAVTKSMIGSGSIKRLGDAPR